MGEADEAALSSLSVSRYSVIQSSSDDTRFFFDDAVSSSVLEDLEVALSFFFMTAVKEADPLPGKADVMEIFVFVGEGGEITLFDEDFKAVVVVKACCCCWWCCFEGCCSCFLSCG